MWWEGVMGGGEVGRVCLGRIMSVLGKKSFSC